MIAQGVSDISDTFTRVKPLSESPVPAGKRCSKCGKGEDGGAVFRYNGGRLRAQCSGCLAAYARESRRKRAEEAASQRPPENPPPDLRCNQCGKTPDDGARFLRDRSRKCGFRHTCKECYSKQRRARYYANLDETRRKRRDWYDAHVERERQRGLEWRHENRDRLNARLRARRARQRESHNAQRRAWYAATREQRNQWQRERYWRDIELTRRRRREWYRKFHDGRYYERYRHKILKRERERRHRRYWADPETARHKDRLYYWAHKEQLSRARRRAQGRPEALGRPNTRQQLRTRSLEAPGPNTHDFALIDHVADTGAIDPQQAALAKETQAAALGWLTTALSAQERQIVEAFADTALDAPAAADLLGMPLAQFEKALSHIQGRARAEIAE